MPCPDDNVFDAIHFQGVCFNSNVTRAHDSAYLKAIDECCSVITGTHLVINDDECWAYCNVSTRYIGIAVGTCENNLVNLPSDVDTSGIDGICAMVNLPDGEDIRSLLPTSLLGSYAHPDPTVSTGATTSKTASLTSSGDTQSLTGANQSISQSITGAASAASTTTSTYPGLPTLSAYTPAASTTSASQGTPIRIPKLGLGLVAMSLGTMLLQC